MYHRLAGAAFAVAFALVSGSLFGGNQQGAIRTLAYDESTGTVSGMTAASTYEALRHNPTTLHQMIGDPDWVPNDSEIGDPDWYVCRDIAQQWNAAVFQARGLSTFRQLLARSASIGCKIEYGRNNVPDANGAYELLAVRPQR